MRGTRDRLRERWERSSAVLRAPRVRIAMSGEEEARAAFRSFTARHPRFKVTGAKRWGVALVPLPATFDEYLAGPSKEYLRRQRRRAEKAGYRYAVVTPRDRLPEILAINRSAPSRQGRAMATSYVDPTRVAETFAARPSLHGILDAQGTLRAYADVSRFGDVIVFSRILGHADDLEHGPMYLLVSEVIRSWVERRGANASPAWAMYDTFWGASSGLAYFKERCGFRPYTVEWVWSDDAPPPARAGGSPLDGGGARTAGSTDG